MGKNRSYDKIALWAWFLVPVSLACARVFGELLIDQGRFLAVGFGAQMTAYSDISAGQYLSRLTHIWALSSWLSLPFMLLCGLVRDRFAYPGHLLLILVALILSCGFGLTILAGTQSIWLAQGFLWLSAIIILLWHGVLVVHWSYLPLMSRHSQAGRNSAIIWAMGFLGLAGFGWVMSNWNLWSFPRLLSIYFPTAAAPFSAHPASANLLIAVCWMLFWCLPFLLFHRGIRQVFMMQSLSMRHQSQRVWLQKFPEHLCAGRLLFALFSLGGLAGWLIVISGIIIDYAIPFVIVEFGSTRVTLYYVSLCAMAFGGLIGGILHDRYSPQRSFVIGLFATLIFVMTLFFPSHYLFLFAVIFFASFAFGWVLVVMWASFAKSCPPGYEGVFFATALVLCKFGILVMQILLDLVQPFTISGADTGFRIFAVITFAVCWLGLWQIRHFPSLGIYPLGIRGQAEIVSDDRES